MDLRRVTVTVLTLLRDLISTAADFIIELQRLVNRLWFLGEFKLWRLSRLAVIAFRPDLVHTLPSCVASPLVSLCEPINTNAAWRCNILLRTDCLTIGYIELFAVSALSTPCNGLMVPKLTVGIVLGPIIAIGRELLRNCVILLMGPMAVESFTCRIGRLTNPLRCLRSIVRRVLCPAFVIVRTLLMTIALMSANTSPVPEASSRNSDLGAAMRTLGGRSMTS